MLRIHTLPALAVLALAGLGAGCTVARNDPDAAFPPNDANFRDAARVDAGPIECNPDTTLGDACTTSTECDDGCFCNGFELCQEGVCVHHDSICADDYACTDDVCDEDADTCTFVPDDTQCDDGDLCNGAETCVVGRGCRPGPRLRCSDGDPCTVGSCDSVMGCMYEPRDLDGDGFADERCGGTDCDDDPVAGATRYPGAEEVCGNGVDDNCDDRADYREPTCTAINDTCDSAEVLAGPGSYVRTTRGASSDYPLGCRPTGIDTVFRFTLTRAQDVEIALAVETGTGAVALRSGASCESGPDTYCGTDSVLARNLPAGDYSVIVRTGSGSTFTLTLTFLDATPVLPTDVCSASTVDIGGGGRFTGFFSDVNHDYQMPCRTTSSTAWKDVAYRMVLTEPSDVELTATSTSTSSVSTYLTLLRDCTAPDSSIACVQSTSAVIRRRSLAPGTYFVLLESSSTAARSWTLDAMITPAAPRNEGDACSSAVDVSGAMAAIPLSMLELDYGTSCGGATSSSRDATFSFELTDVSDVILTTEVGGVHYVGVSPGVCGDPAAEIACTSGTPRTSQRFLRLAAGTYYVTVSTALSSGDVRVSAMIEPPTFPPPNDTCAGATDLMPGVAATGSLLAAADDIVSCGSAGSPDTVHRLVLTEPHNVTLVARRTDGVVEPLSVGLRTDCAGSSTDSVCGSGTPALLNQTLGAGTYYVVVESAGFAAGPYSIIAYIADP